MTTTAPTTMSTAEIMSEALRRVDVAWRAALYLRDHEVADEINDIRGDLSPTSTGDPTGPDRALPVVVAALMGITLSDD